MDAAEVERLRKGLAAKMATQTKVAIAKAVGVSHVTLYAFARGGTAQPETLGKIRCHIWRVTVTKPRFVATSGELW